MNYDNIVKVSENISEKNNIECMQSESTNKILLVLMNISDSLIAISRELQVTSVGNYNWWPKQNCFKKKQFDHFLLHLQNFYIGT